MNVLVWLVMHCSSLNKYCTCKTEQVLASAATICDMLITPFMADDRELVATRHTLQKPPWDVCYQPQTRHLGRGGVRRPTSCSAGRTLVAIVGVRYAVEYIGLDTSRSILKYWGPSLSLSLPTYLLTVFGVIYLHSIMLHPANDHTITREGKNTLTLYPTIPHVLLARLLVYEEEVVSQRTMVDRLSVLDPLTPVRGNVSLEMPSMPPSQRLGLRVL